MKILILLDLDNTLFDSASFKDRMFAKIGDLRKKNDGINVVDVCFTLYDKHMKKYGLLDTEKFLDELSAEVDIEDKDDIKKIIFNVEDMKASIHKDVETTLKYFSQIAQIGLLSQGEDAFQRAKITTFKQYFHPDKIFILRNKKGEMEKIFSQMSAYEIFYIDDMLAMLHHAKTINNSVHTIWIRRGRHAKTQQPIENFEPDAIITDLSEAIQIVQ